MAFKLARREMIALWIGISVIVLMCLLPPWQYDHLSKGHWFSAGYWPVFLEPREWGWRDMRSPCPQPPKEDRGALSTTDLAKVSFKVLNMWGRSAGRYEYVKFEVHNQTDRPLSEITIDVFVGGNLRLMTPEEVLAEKPAATVKPSNIRLMTPDEFMNEGQTAPAPKMTEDEVRAWVRAGSPRPGTAAPPAPKGDIKQKMPPKLLTDAEVGLTAPMVYTSEACTFHTPITPGAQLGGEAQLPSDFKFDANSQQWWALLKAAKWETSPADWAYYWERMEAREKVGESVLVPISAPTRIDTTRLAVQCVLVALLTGGVLFTLRNRAGQSRET